MVAADKLLGAVRAMVVTVDGRGTIVDARGPIEEYLHHRPDECIGRRATDFVAEEDVDLLWAGFGQAPEQTEVRYPVPFRITLVGRDRQEVLVDVLVTNALQDPEISGWVAVLVPHRAMATVTEPLELLLADEPLPVVMTAALRALSGPTPAGWAPFSVALCYRFGDAERCEDCRDERCSACRAGVVAVPGVPAPLLDAIHSCAATEVVPLWRNMPVGTLRDVQLDELPLLVTAVARVHGLVAARVATIEVEGRVEAALLSFYDERSWARAQGHWRQRWERVVQVLAVALHHRRAQHRLQLAATHDGLTGLANRQHFLAALHAYRGQVAVLYVDDRQMF